MESKYLLAICIVCILIIIGYFYINYKYGSIVNIDPVIKQCSERFDLERVYEFDDLLTEKECEMLIERAKPLVKRSDVSSEEKYDDIRTSSHVFLPSDDWLTKKIDQIVYDQLKIPVENYEELQVVNYKPTQKYDEHWDACIHGDVCKQELKDMGSYRYATFIIYLNDGFDGGSTNFPKKNKKVVPKRGKGVLFFNLNDTLDDVRKNSIHAGMPILSGEKWMCNKWIRLKPIKK